MKVSWASSWGVFAALTEAVYFPRNQFSKKTGNRTAECGSNRRFACEADARAAVERELKGKPVWLEVHTDLVTHPQYAGKGRPRKDASPTSQQWQMVTTVTVNQEQVEQEALPKRLLGRWHQRPGPGDSLRPTTGDDLQRPRRC